MGLPIPIMFYFLGLDYQETDVTQQYVPILMFMVGISASIGQYFLDSSYKNVLNKVSVFYSNLNIPRIYSFIVL